MSWFEAIPPFLVALAVILLPGLPVAWAMGARGISFIAVCIAGSVTAIAAAAVVAPILGMNWQPAVSFVVSMPVAVLGLFLRRWWVRFFPPPGHSGEWGRPLVAAIAGIAMGAILVAIPLKAGIGMPDWLAQTPDVSFHFSVVQRILDAGNASSFAVNINPPSAATTYPAAWHAIVALVVQMSGAPIAVAANATTFSIACVIWPVACVFLVRQLCGSARLPMILAGLLSAAFGAFPLLMVQYGVLYPYLLGVSLMPIALGLLVLSTGMARNPGMEMPGRWLTFCWVLVGVAFAHPSNALAVVALSVPLFAQVLIRFLATTQRGKMRMPKAIAIVGFLTAVAGFGLIWLKAGEKTGTNRTRPYQNLLQALGEALTNGTLQRPPAIAASVLMIIGIIVAIRQKDYRWLLASYLITVVLFMIATGWYPGRLRSAFVGIWYNNLPRLAALLPLFAVPLAAIGGVAVIRWIQRRINDSQLATLRTSMTRKLAIAVAAACVLVLAPATQDGSIARAEEIVASTYRLSAESPLISPDELAMFQVVKRVTPTSAVIAGNPWNGSGLVYAYADRKALFPHVLGSWTVEQWELAESFNTGSPSTCRIIRELNVSYVLDFGDRYLTPGNPRVKQYPGFDDLEHSTAVTLVARQGGAKLYKVTGCSE